jgi:hypothetical protein
MEKVISLADVPLAAAGGEPHRNWLKIQRHSMSFNNRGVLADVKQGGLRRDLSLAFEMDGDADVTASEQPALFNQQVGEFVGGTDRLAAPSVAAGMGGVKERFLYRDYHDSGTPFSNDIQDEIYMGHQTVVRGTNDSGRTVPIMSLTRGLIIPMQVLVILITIMEVCMVCTMLAHGIVRHM